MAVVLPYVPADGENEVRDAFARVVPLRTVDGPGADVARQWFYETVVRVHRAVEQAPYTGLNPAGLDVGPVVPLAEKAAERGDVEDVYRLLAADLRLSAGKADSVVDGRAYVQAMLGFEVYTNQVYRATRRTAPALNLGTTGPTRTVQQPPSPRVPARFPAPASGYDARH